MYGIQATWRLEEVLCSHKRSQHRKVDLYESSFYSIRMGKYLLKKALEQLLREAPAVKWVDEEGKNSCTLLTLVSVG